MGLFDFFKQKNKAIAQVATSPSNRMEADISKTPIIVALFKTPRDLRDNTWYNEFYSNVATASFASASPQVLTGPDGFPYFILNTPKINEPFESFCIKNMMDDFLLHQGWGVVLNPNEEERADWVFTHGNIVSLKLNNKFFLPTDPVDIQNIEFTKTVGLLKKEEQVMIAQPSEDYFPLSTRRVLKSFLQSKGIKKPKLMLLTSGIEGKVIRKLAFNIHPENYPVTSKLDYLMQQVGWFLPPDYIIIPLSKKSGLEKGFHDM